MATAVELAVIEMQIVVREMNRRLGGIERRLGIEPEPVPPRDRGRGMTPLSPREMPVVTRRAVEGVEPYDVAGGSETAKDAEGKADEGWEALRTKSDDPAKKTEGPGQTEHTATAHADNADRPATRRHAGAHPPLDVLPVKEPAEPPPSAARVMEFIQSYVPAEKPESTLERTVGLDVVTWLAALAIMGAILFYLKLRMDSGDVYLFPSVRVGLSAVAGVGMLGYGFWLATRKMQTMAAALMGAGVATLMGAVFAGHVNFEPAVFSRGVAFFLIPIIGLLGIALALHQRTVVLALLAFVGMYLSPWILHSTTDHSRVVLAYLILLTAWAIALATLRKNWDHLRLLGFTAAWVWMLAWVSGEFAENNFDVGLVCIAAFFVLFMGDMVANVWAAFREDSAEETGQKIRVEYWDAISAMFSLVNTSLALAACGLLFDKAHLTGLWLVSLLLAAVAALVSRVARSFYFSKSLELQSLVLVVASAPLYFHGVDTTAVWAALALGFGLYANRRNSETARVFMFGTLVLAAGRHFAIDTIDAPLQVALLRLGGNPISTWMLLGWAIGLEAVLLAWLSRPAMPRLTTGITRLAGAPWATIGCIGLSTIVVFIVNVRALTPGDAFTLAAVFWGLALTALLRVRAMAEIDTALEALVAVLLLMLSVKWFVYDGLVTELNGLSGGTLPFWNGFTLSAVMLAVAILALNPMRKQPGVGRKFIAWWMTALLFAFLNMQALWCVDHFVNGNIGGIGGPELFKNVSLTVLWSVFGSVMVGLGFLRKSAPVRYVALTLLAFTVAKIVVVDMANVDTILRVVSFLVLGILLFVVSFLYHLHSRELPGNAEAAA